MAFSWFEKSAQQGLPNALYKLGRMYEEGLGVEINYMEACSFYGEASWKGYKKAREKLRQFYKKISTKSKQGDIAALQLLKKINDQREARLNESSKLLQGKKLKGFFADVDNNENQKLFEKLFDKESQKRLEGEKLSYRYLYTTRIHYEKVF